MPGIKQINMALVLFFLGFLPFSAEINAQANPSSTYNIRFQNGTALYNLNRWQEAAAEFRFAQESAQYANDWSQALYWVILSELAYSDYGSALRDMDELEKITPNSTYTRDMLYHRGRIYYNQGFFDNALILFRRYIDSVTDTDRVSADRRAAAFFWTGECLFTMGRFNEAESFYAWVTARYPESPKFEISTYRIDLIKQKKIEAELLALLQWSHEESLRTSEDYQRRIRTYEYTLNAYQRRIAELTQAGVSSGSGSVNIERQSENNSGSINQSGAAGQIPGVIEQPQEDIPEAESLLEWARRLNNNLDNIIRNNEYGGIY
jgi:tetratricopeptide (TPR) repeat protein